MCLVNILLSRVLLTYSTFTRPGSMFYIMCAGSVLDPHFFDLLERSEFLFTLFWGINCATIQMVWHLLVRVSIRLSWDLLMIKCVGTFCL